MRDQPQEGAQPLTEHPGIMVVRVKTLDDSLCVVESNEFYGDVVILVE